MKNLLMVGAAALILGYPVFHFGTMDTVEAAVITEKERIGNSDGSSRYLVWTENETFQVADSWLALRFRSSDDYGRIGNGATCDLKVNGWRVGVLSAYRNILSADCTTGTN